MKFIIALLLITMSTVTFSANPLLVDHSDLDSTWAPSWGNLAWYWKANGATGYTGSVSIDKGSATCAVSAASSKTFSAAGKVDQAVSVGATGYGQNIICGGAGVSTIADNMTVSLWLKIQSNTVLNYGSVIGSNAGGTCDTGKWQLQRLISTNRLFFRVDTSAGANQTKDFGTFAILDGAWHHVAFSLSGGTIKLYYEGALVLTSTYAHGAGFAGNDGASNTCTSLYLTSASLLPDTSMYDEFAIWNTVLTDADITKIYNRQVNGRP